MSPAFLSIRRIQPQLRPESQQHSPSRQWRSDYVALAAQNLKRWNGLATTDRDAVIGLIADLAARQAIHQPVS